MDNSEVTNIIPTVLLTKLYVQDIAKAKASELTDVLNLIAAEWKLKLSDARDFRVAVKILEQFTIQN